MHPVFYIAETCNKVLASNVSKSSEYNKYCVMSLKLILWLIVIVIVDWNLLSSRGGETVKVLLLIMEFNRIFNKEIVYTLLEPTGGVIPHYQCVYATFHSNHPLST